MREYIKYISIIVTLALVSKSFYMKVNYVDAISIICFVFIYALSELIEDKRLASDVKRTNEEFNTKFKELEKDLADTKNYMSKVSTSVAFRK